MTAMAGWGQDPAHCVERLTELAALGVTRFIVVGPSGVDPDVARAARALLVRHVLPAVREAA